MGGGGVGKERVGENKTGEKQREREEQIMRKKGRDRREKERKKGREEIGWKWRLRFRFRLRVDLYFPAVHRIAGKCRYYADPFNDYVILARRHGHARRRGGGGVD